MAKGTTGKTILNTTQCKNHPSSKATWKCLSCNEELCEACVNVKILSTSDTARCRKCKNMCVEINPQLTTPSAYPMLESEKEHHVPIERKAWWIFKKTCCILAILLVLVIILVALFSNPKSIPEETEKQAIAAYDSRDYDKALILFTKAAESGNVNSKFYLGLMYGFGYGVKKDYNKAFILFTEAAQSGNVRAKVYLGFAYEKGLGVEKDGPKAYMWYYRAAKDGHPWAKKRIEESGGD